jgi:transposase
LQQHPTLSYCPTVKTTSQDTKLWDQISAILEERDDSIFFERILEPIFDTLPDTELLDALEKTRHTGRPGYPIKVMWHTIVAMYVLNFKTYSQLIRELQKSPLLASACGITSCNGIPSKFAYSRFLKKLSQPTFIKMVKDVMRELTRLLYQNIPDFGQSVAIDSTSLKAWANGGKKPVSDPDAGWSVKTGSQGKNEYCFGYKLHLLVDTEYELPIAANISPGNKSDVRIASRVLSEARFTYGKFHPEYIIGDAGYSSGPLHRLIKRQYRAEPMIKINPAHKKALFTETQEWKRIFSLRSSVERIFGRLKEHRRLNNITVRGKRKVTIHCYLSLMVIQAQYLSAVNYK